MTNTVPTSGDEHDADDPGEARDVATSESPADTDHPTGDDQAAENQDNESPS